MSKILLSLTLLAATACGAVEAPSSVEPIEPAEPSCPAGQTCTCTAGSFLGCEGDSARACNAAGNGAEVEACGAPGCNADARRCNSCEPDTASCSAGGTELEHCGADGLPSMSDVCSLGCVVGKDPTPDHCAYLQPMFLPDVCDAPATMTALTLSSDATIDTNITAVCTGGVVTQPGGPSICVIRYGTIEIANSVTIKVRGSLAVAFVADHELNMRGLLDVSADGSTNGPGGGTMISGARALRAVGGGGAGFRISGADGGSSDPAGGGGGLAGAPIDPLSPVQFVGGGRPALPTWQQSTYPVSGGGGGALTLISCRGSVTVTGTIDAGGGGGGGGRDTDLSSATQLAGGAGGGAGGYVVLQGITVDVSIGGVYVNGGAGGGGCSLNGCVGTPGSDATPWGTASGGAAKDEGGTGGNGGTRQVPTKGLASYYSPGGGGAAAGRVQAFVPTTGTVHISAEMSPAFEPNRTIQTR